MLEDSPRPAQPQTYTVSLPPPKSYSNRRRKPADFTQGVLGVGYRVKAIGGAGNLRWGGTPAGSVGDQPRCCAHQVRHAVASAATEAPVMSRRAWKTQPRVAPSRVISSV